MAEQNILILNRKSEEVDVLKKLCSQVGLVYIASTTGEVVTLIEKIEFNVLVVDESLSEYSSLRGLFRTTTSIVITGSDEKKLVERAKSWPLIYYADHHLSSLDKQNTDSLLRTIITASEHSFLKFEVENLRKTYVGSEVKLQEAYYEIQKIKNFINNSIVKEIEKRMSMEAKYLGVKKEKQRIEDTLKRLYIANDVTSLLDIVYDIKDIVHAEGISIYILDENETLGKFLKPLVWDDAFLTHPESTRHFVLIESHDFAAHAAHHAKTINLSDLADDKRLSRRYVEDLRSPLRSLLCVPIMHAQEAIGVLEVYNKIGRDRPKRPGFTAEDEQIMLKFCEHISIAITKLNLIQYDALTGLLRPDPFFDKVIQKLKLDRKRHQEGSSFAMVMGDVDWFKNYNDRNGHEAGNRLLRELAAVLNSSIREEDLLCRYGGEEFLFFLSGISSEEEAIGFTERIRKNTEAHYFENQEFQPNNNLTMSFGVTFFSKDRVKSWDGASKNNLKKLANEADLALAEAKGKRASPPGIRDMYKNRVCIYIRERLKELQTSPSLEKFLERPEKRRHKRYYTSTILIYKRKDFYRVTKTINLSLGGARIPTDSLIDIRQPVDLVLILGNNACQLKGEVVYSMMAGDNYSHFYSGIKFIGLPVKDRKVLEDYFSSLNPRESFLPH
ncbi:MAG: diguanylate cyclase [Candidatus Aminicenantes bacterium]|nr:diguanylate cyclase [Candidatus Aminicenantes bacterium]